MSLVGVEEGGEEVEADDAVAACDLADLLVAEVALVFARCAAAEEGSAVAVGGDDGACGGVAELPEGGVGEVGGIVDDAEGVDVADQLEAFGGQSCLCGVAAGVSALTDPGQAEGDDALAVPEGEVVDAGDDIGALDEDAEVGREFAGVLGVPVQLPEAGVSCGIPVAGAVLLGFKVCGRGGDGLGEDRAQCAGDACAGEVGEGNAGGCVCAGWCAPGVDIVGGGVHVAPALGEVGQVQMGVEPGHRGVGLDRDRLEVGGGVERRACFGFYFVNGCAGCEFGEDELCALFVPLEDGQVGDEHIDAGFAGEGEGACGYELVRVALGDVLHGYDDAFDARDEVHGAAHSLDEFAGDHPVGDVGVLADLHCAEDGDINVPASDHGEGIAGGEEGCAGPGGDGLFAGVDEVGVDGVLVGEGADAEQAVLGLEPDIDALGDVVGDECGDADAEVDDEAVAEFACGTHGELVACKRHGGG